MIKIRNSFYYCDIIKLLDTAAYYTKKNCDCILENQPYGYKYWNSLLPVCTYVHEGYIYAISRDTKQLTIDG